MLHIRSENTLEHVGRTDDVPRQRWMIFAMTSLGVFMATLDASIVQITLPSIAHTFNLPLNGTVEWVSIGYLLMNAAFLLPCGRFADRIGQKMLFMVGIGIFTVASALCSSASTLDMLIAARAIQGLGGAMMLSVSMVILSNTFPHTRGKALGCNTLVVGLGTSAGPALGSVIATVANWHWIFAINIPVGLGALALWFACHGHQTQPSRISRPSQGHFDVLGTLLLVFGLACIMLALSFGQQVGWTSPPILTCATLGLLFLCILSLVERHISHPLLDLRLLHNRVFLCSTISLTLCYCALIAVSFLLPFYCVDSRGDSPLLAGTVLVSFPLSLAAVSPLSGVLADRIGTRWLPTLGLSIAALGLLSISFLSAKSPLVSLVSALVVTGIGQALFLSPNNASLMGSVGEEQRGSASGLLATGRTLGQSLGISTSGAIFTQLGGSNASHLLEAAHQTGQQFVYLQTTFSLAFHATFLVCACLAGVGVIMTCLKNLHVSRSSSFFRRCIMLPTLYIRHSREPLFIRATKSDATRIEIGATQTSHPVTIGGKDTPPVIMAGPCAVESTEQLITTAQAVKQAGAQVLRGGAFKPRTSPYQFQGLGMEGLRLLAEARDATGLPIITEVMDPGMVETVADYADVLQIGTRNAQNFPLLLAAGRNHKRLPILLKRGLASTIDEWLLAAEYILAVGNPNVILCERGIRSYDPHTRNVLDLTCIPLLHRLTHLPIIVDPSHSTGRRELVPIMSRASIAAEADGLIIEVHPDPDQALCDSQQSITPAHLENIVHETCMLTQLIRDL